MTDEARAKAVEAAAGRLASDYYSHVGRRLTMKVATRMTERALDAMAEAGWVMVRDVPTVVSTSTRCESQDWVRGWNEGVRATRAAMLKGSTDGQG